MENKPLYPIVAPLHLAHLPTASVALQIDLRLLSYGPGSPMHDADWPIGASLLAVGRSGILVSFDLCGWARGETSDKLVGIVLDKEGLQAQC